MDWGENHRQTAAVTLQFNMALMINLFFYCDYTDLPCRNDNKNDLDLVEVKVASLCVLSYLARSPEFSYWMLFSRWFGTIYFTNRIYKPFVLVHVTKWGKNQTELSVSKIHETLTLTFSHRKRTSKMFSREPFFFKLNKRWRLNRLFSAIAVTETLRNMIIIPIYCTICSTVYSHVSTPKLSTQ